ncbi:MAG: FAD-dependent oxidoreductase [Alphaproteobacteria bacterium]
MSRDPRYDILFEPVKIGPVTAKNRFYQVPHCTGSGWERPRTLAGLREVKAEGGWAVVNTEYCSVHPACDDTPYPSASLWDDGDIKSHSLMTEKVHAHGALAGVELCLGGARMPNLGTREVALGVTSMPNLAGNPFQTRAMDLADIREVRRWHRNAALRAKKAGFDIAYVYATHGYLLSQFLSTVHNTRSDEYGGSLENRVRLIREIIEDTKEAVGDTMAVAVRFSAETNGGYDGGDGNPMPGETHDLFGILGELPDLWDINVNDYSLEMGLSRFVPQGALEPYIAEIKSLTSKPVVSVGRFTSPDMMASQIKRGILDFIGAARPSIADPFLPKKIEEGRLEDIRECIGCNICYTGDGKGVPIRCTQNPAMSEEWRRGWHPEHIGKKGSDSRVLIVGAGPAGLEAAQALGKRGYDVMLAEATRDLGGRVAREAKLPGLAEWIRVRDYRVQQIEKMTNVEEFRESELTVDDVLAVGADHVAVATGSRWRSDGFGAANPQGVSLNADSRCLFTPDDIMDGRVPEGPTVVFDDDHYYMGSVMAELIRKTGVPVTLVTPADSVSEWGEYTMDRWRARTRLAEIGVDVFVSHNLLGFDGAEARLSCTYSGRETLVKAGAAVLVTARTPNDSLFRQLAALTDSKVEGAPRSVKRIGDCDAPAIIAAAVYSGHRYARELDAPSDPDNPLKHDRVFFEDA